MNDLDFILLQDKNSTLANLCVYVCETPSWRLEPRPLPSLLTSTYTCGVTIALRMCDSTLILKIKMT